MWRLHRISRYSWLSSYPFSKSIYEYFRRFANKIQSFRNCTSTSHARDSVEWDGTISHLIQIISSTYVSILLVVGQSISECSARNIPLTHALGILMKNYQAQIAKLF